MVARIEGLMPKSFAVDYPHRARRLGAGSKSRRAK